MMYKLICVSWIIMVFMYDVSFAIEDDEYIKYIHPRAGANYVSCQSNIIIRFQDKWRDYLNTNIIEIQAMGSISGVHVGRIFQAHDQVTFSFKSFKQFTPNETVSVNVLANLPGLKKSIHFEFITSKNIKSKSVNFESVSNLDHENAYRSQWETYGEMSVINGVSVPSDFPKLTVDVLQETAPGKIFLANDGYGTPYIMILENDGTPYYYKRLKNFSRDFKVQPTGNITRANWTGIWNFVEMDTNYNDIDTLGPGNGYQTDTHDILLLPNGNYLSIAYDFQTMDMSQIVAGGKIDAIVQGNIVQEVDRDGNVLFEWRSWDHYDIVDAVHEDLTDNIIDYVHMNAIAIDYDGHLLVSSRHLSEITKINRETGNIMWRLGGENNQFDFIGDNYGFSYQHDIRPVPGRENHYTMFDNGNFRDPLFSRAVEYLIDTSNMTARKIWEYRNTPDHYRSSRGSVQRLPNGNTLIDWAGGTFPIASEISQDGEIVYEISFIEYKYSYRSFRFDWESVMPVPYLIAESWPDKVSLIFNKFGDNDVTNYIIYGGKDSGVMSVIDSTTNTWIDLSDLENNRRYYFRVKALNMAGEESDFSNQAEVYVRYIDPGENLILNGDFSQNNIYWDLETSGGAIATGIVEDEEYHLNIEEAGTLHNDVRIKQEGFGLIKGKHYIFEFDAYAAENRIIETKLEKKRPPFTNYGKTGFSLIQTNMTHYRFEFDMEHNTDIEAQLVFNMGGNNNDVIIDNVSLKEVVASSIQRKNDIIPKAFQLFKNYPNPFNPTTTINYELPIRSDVNLCIFNLLGQKIAILVSEKQQAGNYRVEWDASEYASGIYYYKMEVRTPEGKILFNKSKKMVVIK